MTAADWDTGMNELHYSRGRLQMIVQSRAAGCKKGLVESLINVPQAVGPTILNLPFCQAAQAQQGELSENNLQNLFHNLTPQTVHIDGGIGQNKTIEK